MGKEVGGDADVGMTAFLLKLGEGRVEVSDSRLYISAITIASGYAVGGLLPMVRLLHFLPFFFSRSLHLEWSLHRFD